MPDPGSNPVLVFLDESGDLGWKFDAPYGQGGSSRYLTIASVCVPPSKNYLLDRTLRAMYQKYKWQAGAERKFVQLTDNQRVEFATNAMKLCHAHPDIAIHGIVVRKENVEDHIRADGNKLYNFMIKLSLIKKMAEHSVVTLIPDPRSIKVESGNSMPDYLQTELWFTEKALTNLICKPQDSARSRGIQFADMISGIVQARHERNETQAFQIIAPKIKMTQLFFHERSTKASPRAAP